MEAMFVTSLWDLGLGMLIGKKKKNGVSMTKAH
jgi:hypothetical protein